MNNTRMLIRSARGPILLIVLGALFAVDHHGEYSFWQTWPILLIVFGALWLLERVAGTDGYGTHAGGSQ